MVGIGLERGWVREWGKRTVMGKGIEVRKVVWNEKEKGKIDWGRDRGRGRNREKGCERERRKRRGKERGQGKKRGWER